MTPLLLFCGLTLGGCFNFAVRIRRGTDQIRFAKANRLRKVFPLDRVTESLEREWLKPGTEKKEV